MHRRCLTRSEKQVLQEVQLHVIAVLSLGACCTEVHWCVAFTGLSSSQGTPLVMLLGHHTTCTERTCDAQYSSYIAIYVRGLADADCNKRI